MRMACGKLAATTVAVGVLLGSSLSSPANAAVEQDDQAEQTYVELEFAHPVSLESALTLTDGDGIRVEGYRFESSSIAGDFWPDAGLSAEDFLAEIAAATGTAPEVVGAYVDSADHAKRAPEVGPFADAPLGAELPVYVAPPGDPVVMSEDLSPASTEGEAPGDVGPLAVNETWQPTTAEAMVTPSGTTLAIRAKYNWYGTNPFASPTRMADHWGMEFQFDFYTKARPHQGPPPTLYGKRPYCGTTTPSYKDWAAASTRPFSWFAWVISGNSQIVAPNGLGLYGDFNDLSDPCTVSTIAVGMAFPRAMPHSTAGTNQLALAMYPKKGDDVQSVLGAIVQPVSRTHCERYPNMPLMDCMGVAPGTYPGPGRSENRMVLNSVNGRKAPSLCWYSPNYGDSPAQLWSCTQ